MIDKIKKHAKQAGYTAKLYKDKFIYINEGWNKSYLRINKDFSNFKLQYVPSRYEQANLVQCALSGLIELETLKELYKPVKQAGFTVGAIEDKLSQEKEYTDKTISQAVKLAQTEKNIIDDLN